MSVSPWKKEAEKDDGEAVLKMYSVILVYIFARKGDDTFETSTVHGCTTATSPEGAIENIGGGMNPGTFKLIKEEAFDITEFVVQNYRLVGQ